MKSFSESYKAAGVDVLEVDAGKGDVLYVVQREFAFAYKVVSLRYLVKYITRNTQSAYKQKG